jgi:alkanesulfonate monooxygenase SsuD/methylene tetrahydromethanopterin reductase-like flavin-dependent oxidoreductase (luciferase family)
LLGFGVLVLPLRPVAWLAAQLATLQHLSGNRVLLGIGSGGFPDTPFWQALGVSGQERGRKTEAALDVLPPLLAGEATQLEEVPIRPVVQLAPAAPLPPLLIGGNTEVAMRRAVSREAAWFPSLISPAGLVRLVGRLETLATAAGRVRPPITIGGHALLNPDPQARETFIRRLIDLHHLPPQEAALVPLGGSPQQLADRFAAYAEAGAERLVLALDDGQWLYKCEQLARALELLK